MQYKDYYKTLGVDKKASAAEIKSAYRKLTKKFHPDINKDKGSAEKFKDINEAYEVLSDKEKRSRYDSLGSDWDANSNFTPPPGFEGFNFHQGGGQRAYSQSSVNFEDLGGFSDFFKTIFGDLGAHQQAHGSSSRSRASQDPFAQYYNDFGQGGAGASGRARTSSNRQPATQKKDLDVTQNLIINAKDIFSSKPINIKLNMMEPCKKCNGPGSVCSECYGSGFMTTAKSLKVKLPSEIKEGQKIRLTKEGKVDEYCQKGDLYLIVKFNDKEYSINGADLTKHIEIEPYEAVLGTKKEVSTLHGKITITIPERTQSGKILRLKELGLPKKSGGFGALDIKIAINIPKLLSDKQVELYKKLKDLA